MRVVMTTSTYRMSMMYMLVLSVVLSSASVLFRNLHAGIDVFSLILSAGYYPRSRGSMYKKTKATIPFLTHPIQVYPFDAVTGYGG